MFKDLQNDALVGISIFCAVIKTFFLTYVFADFNFAASLVVIVLFDFGLGVYFALKEKDFDPKQFGTFLEKLVVYSAVLVAGHVLTNYEIDGQKNSMFVFIKTSLYTGMIIREVASILKFAGKRFPGFAKDVLKYFRGFTSEGLPERNSKHQQQPQ